MEDPVGLVATEDIVGVGGPVGMVDIMVATEDTMAGMVDIMAEAISMEVPASTSVGTLGTPTTIRTGILLTLIIILHLITTLIDRRALLGLPPSPNRSQTPMGITARLRQSITPASQAIRAAK